MSLNDEVERRGFALPLIEAALSRSSTPSLAHRRRDPRSLEPIVRRQHTARAAGNMPTAHRSLIPFRDVRNGIAKGGAGSHFSIINSQPRRTPCADIRARL